MICEMQAWGDLPFVWLMMSLIAVTGILSMSSIIFYCFYAHPTFEWWQYKSNPNYPSPKMVRMEVVQTIKGAACSTLLPALSLWMTQKGYSQAYCGVDPKLGAKHFVLEFFVVWFGSDFLEFFYHYCGHRFTFLWSVHKHHHVFNNPSPFAVIADEYVDQIVRSLPLALFPILMPTNIDLLFVIFAVFFYGYGVYLHFGFEFNCLPADHRFINTSFQHYLHHAVSVKNRPYHCGFFFKFWDQLAGSLYHGDQCISAMEARKRGLRTKEAWEKVVKPDYSPLLSLSFWLSREHRRMHEE